MKQKHLLKSLLLLLAIMAGSSAWADTVTDELTASDFAATSTTYTVFSNVSKTSDAVYAGNSAKDSSGNIQMRSKNSNSGIVSTTSGGRLKSVTITVGSGSNQVDVYGSNTAYTDASDLYNNSTQGTKLGSVTATGTITVEGDYEYVGIRSYNGAIYLSKVEIVWETEDGDPRTATTITIDDKALTNTNVFDGTAAGSLSAMVLADNEEISGASVTWSGNNDEVATIDETTGAVTLVAAGSVTFTANYAGDNNYKPSTATYTLTVTNSDPNAPGTANNPYTVAQAIEFINTLGTSSSTEEVYVSGIISQVDSYNDTYKSITYWISDDGTTTSQMEVYSGKGLNGADFSSVDDLAVGDVVTVKGIVKMYNSTPEFDKNNQLVSLQRAEKPATPTFSPAEGTFYEAQNVTISCETEGADIYYTIEARFGGEVYTPESVTDYTSYSEPISLGLQNYSLTYTIRAYAEKDGKKSDVAENTITIDLQKYVVVTPLEINLGIEGGRGTLSVSFINYPNYQSDTAGFHYWKRTDTGTQMIDNNIPEWFHIEYSDDYSTLTYTVDPNTTTEKRDIEVEFWVKNTFSDMIHFTQEGIVLDYAELPFEFDGGKADIEDTDGLTQEGLDSDYSSSPKLKFNSTGDYVILHFDEVPGKLTFDIKGNSFSGGTFTVQTSEDGVTYTDLETYTELGTTQSEGFNNLGENVRYIKWVYTEKSNGNVALGNIKLAKPGITQQYTLTVEPFENLELITFVNDEMVMEGDGEIQVNEGDQIMLSIVASEGYVMKTLMVNGEDHVNDIADDFTYSFEMPAEAVTISATAVEYVAPTPGNWVLTDLADLTENDVFVIVGNNGDTYALPNDGSTSSAPAAVAVTVVDGTLSGDIAANLQWTLTSEEDGYTFYPYGDSETWLYCTNTNNGVRVGTNTNNLFTVENGYLKNEATGRYVGIYNSQDWRCYTTCTGNSNIADQTFSFYKKVSAEVESITVSAAGYRTYCSENALDFSDVEGLTAYKATITDNQVSFTPVTQVPAGQGVLLKGAAATYDIPVINAADALEGNAFIGVTEETTIDTDPENGIYVLMNPEGGQGVGFYKTTGSTFTLGANTAYLPAKAGGARSFIGFDFDNTTTAIEGVATVENRNGEIYNLQGQRVVKAQKGLYIINGKKMVIK